MAIPRKNRNIPAELRRLMNMDNIASELDDNKLAEIGMDVVNETQEDEASRYKWLEQLEKALKIARQDIEEKNTPWPGASNTKYPLMLKGAIQFNAFTLPQVVRNGKTVAVEIMLQEPTKEQEERASRIEEHMSYQMTEEIPNWKGDTDKLLMTLATHGIVYRKSYFDSIEKKPAVDFCLPRDIIINNNVESIEKAPGITHRLHLDANNIITRMRAGIYLTYDIDELTGVDNSENNQLAESEYEQSPETPTYVDKQILFERHKWLDLDDDGYAEPYTVTVHLESKKTLRIAARYDEDSFVFEEGVEEFIKINPINHFTDYHFIPAPDGTYHSLGFGHILYPLNETINSLTNQLVDAGTLANRGGGFISNGLRINKGSERFVLGEFKKINLAPGQTLQQSIFPMPVKEGSQTLFSLLTFLLQAAEGIANVSALIEGKDLPANAPATTVLALIEQGSKVYSAMMIRLHEALKKEYKKLYNINKKYLTEYEDYQLATKSGQIKLEDYQDPSYAIIPLVDPSVSSDVHRLMRSKALIQVAESPLWEQAASNPYAHEILHQFLETLHIQNIDKILPVPPTPEELKQQAPSPQEQLAHAEIGKISAQIQNIDADTSKKEVEKGDIVMGRELEAIKLGLQEDKQHADAAFMGSQVTATKINSLAKMAEVDAELGPQQVEMAEQQVAQLTPPLQAGSPDVEMRLRTIEDAMQKMLGFGPQAAPQTPPQGEAPQPDQPPQDNELSPQGGPEAQNEAVPKVSQQEMDEGGDIPRTE